jgi:hypothetical protein
MTSKAKHQHLKNVADPQRKVMDRETEIRKRLGEILKEQDALCAELKVIYAAQGERHLPYGDYRNIPKE